jgi:hypothetical protein
MAKPLFSRIIGAQTEIEETPMNHDETIALAEQHRSALLADAAGTRRRRSVRLARRLRRRT